MRGTALQKQQQMTQQQAKAQLLSLLYNCRPERLREMSAEELVRTHRVPLKLAEYELAIARQKRAEEIASA